MSHDAYEALISAQLDGDLSPEEEAGLEAHLAICPQCRAAKAEARPYRNGGSHVKADDTEKAS